MDDMKTAASQNFTFGVHVRYACDRPMLLVHKGFRVFLLWSMCWDGRIFWFQCWW